MLGVNATQAVATSGAYERGVDVGRGELPGIVELGDKLAHEALVERERPRVVAEMVGQEGKGKLRRPGALIGPLEPGRRELLQIAARVERPAVDGHHRAIEAAPAAVELHRGQPRPLFILEPPAGR